MKKCIVVLVFLAFIVAMTGCNLNPSSENGATELQKMYNQLDELSALNYKKIKLNITSTTGNANLSANYILTENTISYSIEQLNKLSTDKDLNGLSPEYKTTLVGTAKVVNGEITEFDGDSVSLPAYSEIAGNFNFTSTNFKNTVIEENSLRASVISPSEFYGSDVTVENMKVEVVYNSTTLIKITITYKTEHSSVVATYEFE